ncbi:ATP-binding protein [Kitasatospora sp. NPDC048194]|uniref:ATP-binding protein n=1 Tax=Kitasatospora sp. NPDC048194 TaxID=3364045 RepID=UPI0037202CA1
MQVPTSVPNRTTESAPAACRSTSRHASWRHPAIDISAGAARRETRSTLAAWDLAEIADAAELCVSELVTNAITHARHPDATFQLDLARHGDHLLVAASDADGPAIPHLRIPEDGDEHGRGLLIVRALSTAWGVAYSNDGLKTVWCRLETHVISESVRQLAS